MKKEIITEVQDDAPRMRSLIKTEEAALTLVSIYFLYQNSLGLPAWLWLLLFFTPDISMLGYLSGTRVGAFTYNLFHHCGLALCIACAGYYFHYPVAITIGILLFAHSSFDRLMGYGLKYTDSFKHTHLGWLPENKK